MLDKVTFRPTDSWRWYFDNEYDCLMLEIADDMVFRSCYPSKMLIPDVFTEFPFSVSDATAYYQYYDSCTKLNLTEPQKIELAINSIIAANFLKPQMPKSWYFMQQPIFFTPKVAEVVEAHMQDGCGKLSLMVVEAGINASVCVVAQPPFTALNKTFFLAEAIKVMNDRLIAKPDTAVDEFTPSDNLIAIS